MVAEGRWGDIREKPTYFHTEGDKLRGKGDVGIFINGIGGIFV